MRPGSGWNMLSLMPSMPVFVMPRIARFSNIRSSQVRSGYTKATSSSMSFMWSMRYIGSQSVWAIVWVSRMVSILWIVDAGTLLSPTWRTNGACTG